MTVPPICEQNLKPRAPLRLPGLFLIARMLAPRHVRSLARLLFDYADLSSQRIIE